MTNGPTTTNGPLHDEPLGDLSISASFADLASAQAARSSLIEAGIDKGCVDLDDKTHVTATASPADDGLIGRIREAILPEDGETATRSAIRPNETILTLRPQPDEIEKVIAIIEAAKPTHFDADLERWRNAR